MVVGTGGGCGFLPNKAPAEATQSSAPNIPSINHTLERCDERCARNHLVGGEVRKNMRLHLTQRLLAFAAISQPRDLRCPAILARHEFAAGLPIEPVLPQIEASLSESPNLVLEAPPGAGKTTTVPLALLESDWVGDGQIIVLEPRRVAARGAAARMASLINEPLGGKVGFCVRHESKASSATRVLVVTTGVLVRRLQSDPSLEGVSAVIFDEFHERSVDADLALALCRVAQTELRPELRLLVMSATLGSALAPAVSSLLGDCPALSSEGRSFPVDVRHLAGARPLGMAAAGHPRDVEADVADAVMDVLSASAGGDVLVFLPGEREIRGVQGRLSDGLPAAALAKLLVLPLYGALPFDQQQRAIAPADPDDGRRRVILSTSLAESSLTISGVRHVVDSGLRRTSAYDPNVGMSALVTRPISQAAAEQRAGRAGRVAPGAAHRLWSGAEHKRLQPQCLPEMSSTDLAPLVLQLAAWGGSVHDAEVLSLPWLTPPPAAAMERARSLLLGLRALTTLDPAPAGEDGASSAGAPQSVTITPHGAALASLPTHPRLAHILTQAARAADGGDAALEVACAAVAVIEERDVLRGGAREHGSDLRKRVRALLESSPPEAATVGAWRRADKAKKELMRQAARLAKGGSGSSGSSGSDSGTGDGGGLGDASSLAAAFAAEAGRRSAGLTLDEQVAACGALLAGGFHDRIAQRQPGKQNVFALSNGRGASFFSAAEPLSDSDYLVCLALDGGDKASARIQLACPLSLSDVRRALGGSAIVWRDETFLAPSDGSVRRRRVERLGSLVLSDEPLPSATPEEARPLLLAALRERGLRRALLSSGTPSVAAALELIARVRLMRALEPEGGWPEWSEAELLRGAEDPYGWLASALDGATSLKQLGRADLRLLLEQSLPYDMQVRLRECAPAAMETPSGSMVKLAYVRDGFDPLAENSWQGRPADEEAEEEDEGREEGSDDGEGDKGGEGGEVAEEAVAPILAAKLQEWFGATETPCVGPPTNRMPVLLHLLTPAGRPAAITSDLVSFWAGPYAGVRADLRDKYKRHPWPEDPANASPTKMTNRALAKQASAGAGKQAASGKDDKAGGSGGGAGGGGGGGSSKKKKKKGGGASDGNGKFPAKKVPKSFKRR